MPDTISEKWLPSDWMDEWVPAPQKDPSAFIKGPVGDLWLVAPEGHEHEAFYRKLLTPGDVVDFMLCRTWPSIEVTIGADLKIEKHDPMPEGATLFWADRDSDTISEDLDTLVKDYMGLEPGTLDVEPYDWSISAQFRLVVDAAGAHFEKVEKVAADG